MWHLKLLMKNNKKRLPYTLPQVMVSIREQLNLRIDNRQYPKYGHKKIPIYNI